MQPVSNEEKTVYRFEGFELDPIRRLLLKDGLPAQLTPKTLDTLLVLVRNRGRVMSKDELMQAIWPDTIVEETNLAHNISSLRKIFGQKGGENRFIVTVPARGYSFVAEVQQETRGAVEKEKEADAALPEQSTAVVAAEAVTEAVAEAAPPPPAIQPAPVQPAPDVVQPPAAQPAPVIVQSPPVTQPHASTPVAVRGFHIPRQVAISLIILVGLLVAGGLIWTLRPTPGRPIRSVAVLPFKPLVADSRDEVLEMGMADTLITRLSSLKEITVRPISSVRKYTALDQDPATAGRELAVEAVLEGSIQKAEGKIRVTAQLVRTSDGQPIWRKQFDEQWTNIFTVQDAISNRVAGDLALTLNGGERDELARNYTSNPEAYQLYLQGRYYWNKRSSESVTKSIDAFNQAIAQDPNYALPYVGLADAYATQATYYWAAPIKVVPIARENAEHALRIDQNLAEAHASMGKILTDFYWDWNQAEKEFQTAIELKPNYANAHHWYAILLGNRGRADESIREIDRALELDYLSPAASTQVGALLYRARRYDEAIATLQKTLGMEPNFVSAYAYLGASYLMQRRYNEGIAALKQGVAVSNNESGILSILGYAYGVAGQRDQARLCEQQLQQMADKGYVSPASFAVVACGLGEMDTTFKWLEQCLKDRVPLIRGIATDPIYDSLHADPRYVDLLHRIESAIAGPEQFPLPHKQ